MGDPPELIRVLPVGVYGPSDVIWSQGSTSLFRNTLNMLLRSVIRRQLGSLVACVGYLLISNCAKPNSYLSINAFQLLRPSNLSKYLQVRHAHYATEIAHISCLRLPHCVILRCLYRLVLTSSAIAASSYHPLYDHSGSRGSWNLLKERHGKIEARGGGGSSTRSSRCFPGWLLMLAHHAAGTPHSRDVASARTKTVHIRKRARNPQQHLRHLPPPVYYALTKHGMAVAKLPTRKIGDSPVSALGYGAMVLLGAYGPRVPDEEQFKVQ